MECKNCNKSVGDRYTYCPHCGQKMGLGRLNLKQLLRDLWIAFSNTDYGILLLVKQLVYRPGKVARDYISGKRKTYFNPFSYLVLMVAIALYFILQFENEALIYSKIGAESDNTELLRFTFKYFNVFILLMCPIYGVLIWLFFLGRHTNFVENLALTAYLSGQSMLYYIIALTLFIIFPSFVAVLGVIFGLMISIWYVAAVLQFYRTRSVWSILKIILIIIITQFITQGIILSTFSIYKKLII